MKRRDFLAAAGVAGLAPMSSLALAQPAGAPVQKELYELRVYTIETPAKQKAMEDYLCEAAVPALNRLGIQPVGVFKMMETQPEKNLNLFVLLPHKSMESVATTPARLMADAQFVKAAASLLDAPMKDPVYKRIESSLLLAFDAVPKLEVPSRAESRVLQLRIYESHNEKKAMKKIAMFNEGGEVGIFRHTGLNPVFFGQALSGPKLPNLTYMVGFDDVEAQKKAWAAFIKHPDWEKLKNDPQYADTVSNITNILLQPAAGSQI
jgi:hypothetical protein